MEKNYFTELYGINVSSNIKKKNGFNYLSWAYAWAELKKIHPNATSKVYENQEGWPYFTDGKTCWVKVGVTVMDIEHIEYFPILDFRNKSIPLDGVNSFVVNTAIQRALTKAIARHGIGLYIYAGEDLPPDMEDKKADTSAVSKLPNWAEIQKRMQAQSAKLTSKL